MATEYSSASEPGSQQDTLYEEENKHLYRAI